MPDFLYKTEFPDSGRADQSHGSGRQGSSGKMLTSYEGTVLFVSHDRYFINQVATGILAFGENDVQFYGMNYAQYLEEIKRQTPGRETGNAATNVRKPADVPTLEDVFDKKKYYNPGKILSRLKRQLEKYEQQLAESESRLSELQLEMMDPELSADYERLMEIQTKIDEENKTQESPAGRHDGDRTGTGRIRGRGVKRGENDRKDITVHCRIKSGRKEHCLFALFSVLL